MEQTVLPNNLKPPPSWPALHLRFYLGSHQGIQSYPANDKTIFKGKSHENPTISSVIVTDTSEKNKIGEKDANVSQKRKSIKKMPTKNV